MAAAAPLNIWDAQHNANGGAYFSGYSADFAFRQTVAEDFLSKEQTVAACARHWKKSDGFVRKAVDDFLTSHTLAPRARGGFRGEAAFAFEDLAYLDVCVQQRPRDHVWQHRLRLLQDLGIDIPESTVKHAICSVLGYNHRVLSSIATERFTSNNVLKLVAYQQYIQGRDHNDVAFFDEAGVCEKTGNSRYGFGRVGERTCVSDAIARSRNHSVMALCGTRFPVQAITIAGGAKGDDVVRFFEIVAPLLVATHTNTVVMDNCKTHYDVRLRAMLNAVGIRLVFLPPYSPYLNPIEMVFGKMKHLLKFRRAELISGNVLGSVADALEQVTTEDVKGYYRHCTYTV